MFGTPVSRLEFILVSCVHVALTKVADCDSEGIDEVVLRLCCALFKVNQNIVALDVVVGHVMRVNGLEALEDFSVNRQVQ